MASKAIEHDNARLQGSQRSDIVELFDACTLTDMKIKTAKFHIHKMALNHAANQ